MADLRKNLGEDTITLPSTSAPSVTTNKLYNEGGAITWDGTDLTVTSAGGSNTQIQVNNGGVVDGILGFYYNDSTENILAQSASAPTNHWFEINSNNLAAGNNVLRVRSSSNIATGAILHVEHSAIQGGADVLRLNGQNNSGNLIAAQDSGTNVFVIDDEGYITEYPGTPGDGEVLTWVNANSRFEPVAAGSGGVSQYDEAFTNASLVGGVLTVTHSLGRQYVQVAVYDDSDVLIQPDTVTATSTTVTTIDLTSFGVLAGTWNVVII